MRLEWIDDLLAVLHTGSLSRAAEQRFISQPAFSRRIKSIEDYLGVELIDRTKKPAQISGNVLKQQQTLETLSGNIRDLLYDLRQQERKRKNRVVIAGQHANITSIAIRVIRQLGEISDTDIVLRSANRDECFFLLATNQADLAIIYRVPGEVLPLKRYLIEECSMGEERMIPVFASERIETLNEQYQQGEIPIIAYPRDVFLGQVTNREIFSTLRTRVSLRTQAETALTLAAAQLALEGVGVSWVPQSVALKDLQRGDLTNLEHFLPQCRLSISAVRISGQKSPAERNVWDALTRLSCGND